MSVFTLAKIASSISRRALTLSLSKQVQLMRLPAASIVVAHRVEGSGTTFNWVNYLSKASAEWRSNIGKGLSVAWPVGVGGKGNEGVAAFVRQTRNSIGYVDYTHALRSKLAYGLVQNRAGKFVLPGVKAFESAATTADWASADDFHVVITDALGDDSYPIAATSNAISPPAITYSTSL
jgi:phosphate transport system substrate-binding protein